MTDYKNLIIDMDGTLNRCAEYYIECQQRLADYQSSRTGIDRSVVLKLQEKIDVEFTPLPDGFKRDRFPRSFAATSATIDVMLNNPFNYDAFMISLQIGNDVFSAPYALFDGVSSRLHELRDSGLNLFICSKGDFDVQMNKVEKNDLYRFFPKEHIHIVPQKKQEHVEDILTQHSLHKDETMFIGDSIRDDISSANAAGIHSAWVYGDSQKKWEYENTHSTPTYSIEKFTDIYTIVGITTKV